MKPVNLAQKLASFSDLWSPKIVGALNGQYVKLVKVHGEYIWHRHDQEDELFLVLDGSIDLHFRDRTVTLATGEFCIVPRGVEHKPAAASPASILLFEPAATRNTGNVDHVFTIESDDLEHI